jgi:nucleotide-binding universal stress UspA family protein
MFRNVVVGVDEHEGARDAIALAKNLLAWNGELSLVHVLAHDGHGYRGPGAAYEAFSLQRVAELLEQARKEAGVDAEIRWRASGSVGRGLHELCELVGADLLVVGSSRRGLIGRVLMRDDARAALNGAPCAIAIAPPAYSEGPVAMHEIGVGYDGSAESAHALELARALAAETGAKVSAFEAVAMPVTGYVAGKQLLKDAVEAVLSEARDTISQLGDVEAHVALGDPAEELALYSASLDLLIVGSRGYGPVGRLIHGSTSQRLAHMARCPLLVLPRSAAAVEPCDVQEADRERALNV